MEPYVGEIRIFAGNFAPKGWAFCNGQLMPLMQNTALFSILGTMYGGDGKNTFALPNLQGAAPMHQGQGPGLTARTQGAVGGSANVTLLTTQIPAHNHIPTCQSTAGTNDPTNATWATIPASPTITAMYVNSGPNTEMAPTAVAVTGGSQPHNNMQPYLGLNFIIALQGQFPPRS
ncbi:phage tail protein [Brevibacillus dissolubilis]|uniref:phage tail protein n=1 Tax=Brevibacillus dissolubilis TaxID=1844116 RepID=UPI001115C380|nr:tail fiber protein [Brevibacillus dissolubilis]